MKHKTCVPGAGFVFSEEHSIFVLKKAMTTTASQGQNEAGFLLTRSILPWSVRAKTTEAGLHKNLLKQLVRRFL